MLTVGAAAHFSHGLTYDPASPNGDNWDLTSVNWDGSTVPWTNGSSAVFSGTGEAVNINAGISATSITFSAAGFTLADAENDGSLTITTTSGIRADNTTGVNTISENIDLATALNSTVTVYQQGTGGTSGTLVASGNISDGGNNVRLSLARGTSGGTIVLSGDNTFGGGIVTANSQMSLHLNSATAPGTGGLTFSQTFTLNNSSGSAITLANNNNITLTAGTLTWGGSNNLSLGSGTITLVGNRAIDTNGTATLTAASLIGSATDSLNKGGASGSMLFITGDMTFGGALTVGNGGLGLGGTMAASSLTLSQLGAVVQLQNPNAVANTPVNHNTGTLQLRSDTDNAFYAMPSYTNSGTGTTTINVDRLNSGSNLTLRMGDLNMTNAATQTLAVTGGNGYGLRVGTITQSNATATTLTINNSAPFTIANLVSASGSASAKFAFTGSGVATITGNITQGSGTLSLEKSGSAGTLVLQGTSNMTGGVVITTGTIQTAVATNAFGSTSGVTLGGSGILALRGDSSATFGNGVTPYNLALSATGGGVNVDRAASGTSQTFILGTLALPGAYTFNATGANGSSLQLGAVTGSTANNKVIANNITGGGGLTIASYAESDASARTITFNGTGTTTVAGSITQNGANALTIAYSGSGRLNLNGTNSNTGNITITGGQVVFSSLAATGGSGSAQVGVSGTGTAVAGYAIDQTFLNRVITTGLGTVALGADSSNALSITGGGYYLGSSGGFTYSGALKANALSTWRLGGGGGTLTISSQLLAANGTTVNTNTGTNVVLAASNTYVGTTTPGTNSTLTGIDTAATHNSGDTITPFGIGGVIGAGNTGTTLSVLFNGQSDSNADVVNLSNAQVQGSGGGQTVTLNTGRASGSGTNKVLGIPLLNFAVGASGGSSTINFTASNGYSYRITGATAVTMGGAAASGNLVLNPTGSTSVVVAGNVTNSGTTSATKWLHLGGTTSGNAINGVISDNGTSAFSGVAKMGSSRWTLAGNNTYTLGTTVSAGTLLVNGVGSTTVSSGTGLGSVQVVGGTLGGTGRVLGNTTVSGGATLLAGDGANATENLELAGTVDLADGSTIALVLGSGFTHSTLTRTGSAAWNFDDGQAVSFVTSGVVSAGTYEGIITGLSGTALAGNTALLNNWTITTAGLSGTFTYDSVNNEVDLNLSSVPEPASLGLLLLGGTGLLGRRRRKQ